MRKVFLLLLLTLFLIPLAYSETECTACDDYCVHGECRWLPTYCGDGFCDANELCNCEDCEEDDYCKIELKKSDGENCIQNKECSSGICIGTCQPAKISCGNGKCEINESCSCRDCNTSISCKIIEKKIQDGEKCTDSNECLYGSYCAHGSCRAANSSCGDGFCDYNESKCRDCDSLSLLKQDGEECLNKEECGGGYCSNNLCSSSKNTCGDDICNEDERCNCRDCLNQQRCLIFPFAGNQIYEAAKAMILMSVIASLAIGLLSIFMTWKGKHLKGEEKQEYTFRTLLFPQFSGKNILEKVSLIIISPFFWIAETILFLSTNAIITALQSKELGSSLFMLNTYVIIFSIGFPLAIMFIAWLIDYYEREPLRFVFGMFMWGTFSTLIPLIINTFASLILLPLGTTASITIVAILVAPLIEEVSKGIGLLLISAHHEFDDINDGLLYGFAIGVGFAFFENLNYITEGIISVQQAINSGIGFETPIQATFMWLSIIFLRIFFLTIGHGIFTATTGLFTGLFKQKFGNTGMKYLGFGIGLAGAITLHFMNNLLGVSNSPILMIIQFILIGGVALTFLIIAIANQSSKKIQKVQAA